MQSFYVVVCKIGVSEGSFQSSFEKATKQGKNVALMWKSTIIQVV